VRIAASSAESPLVWDAHASTQDRVQHRARIGFTAEQVTVALGQPLTTQSITTVAGLTEVWKYATHRVTLRNGVVTGVMRT
jgi:hypothetical protein